MVGIGVEELEEQEQFRGSQQTPCDRTGMVSYTVECYARKVGFARGTGQKDVARFYEQMSHGVLNRKNASQGGQERQRAGEV